MLVRGQVYTFVRSIAAALLVGLGSMPAFATTYFDWLSARSERIASRSYTDQAQIDADIHGQPDRTRAVYDASKNAAKLVFPANVGNARQLRPGFSAASSGNVLLVWEARWGSGWSADGGVGGINTHKAFQLSAGGSLTMEIRAHYFRANKPNVAMVDVRPYTGAVKGSLDSLAGQDADFTISPEVWTRFWALADFDSDTLSLWVADESKRPVLVHDRTKAGWDYLDQFWFEFNSSQSRTGPEIYVWVRNFVALRNVADAAAIVAQGAVVGGDVVSAPDTPQPPSALSVQ